MNHIQKILTRTREYGKCEMCGKTLYSLWFLWVGMLTETEVRVCRDCAYKEEYGSKNANKNKKNKVLEKTLIND